MRAYILPSCDFSLLVRAMVEAYMSYSWLWISWVAGLQIMGSFVVSVWILEKGQWRYSSYGRAKMRKNLRTRCRLWQEIWRRTEFKWKVEGVSNTSRECFFLNNTASSFNHTFWRDNNQPDKIFLVKPRTAPASYSMGVVAVQLIQGKT